MSPRSAYDRLGTAAKLLLVLSFVMLPIGGLLVWSALRNLEGAGASIAAAAEQRARLSASTLENLIARNALALRVAANAALSERGSDACADAATTLAIAPAVARRVEMFNATVARVVGEGLAQSLAGLGVPALAAGDLARDVGGLLDVATAKRPFAAVVHCLCEAP